MTYKKEILIGVQVDKDKVEKQSILLYNRTWDKESFISTVNEFPIIIKCYPLIQDQAHIVRTVNHFLSILLDTMKPQFINMVTIGPLANYDTFQHNIWALTNIILWTTVLHNQMVYLKHSLKHDMCTVVVKN